ncbi:MAG: PH domain-containing protein [Methylotenera sp.]|nr:PH domain-containing protein [Methylotenera sp.]MDP2404296.1 PH domain-containing protein [Methylotenera sp.]MDP3095959.1 PH domain-containing protein [Methylotenera sp.]MDZ4223642.1 PH domain-containing protein [Methylotenera sp.]
MNNFDKYSEYTKANNWGAICELNNVKLDSFGTKKELNVLAKYLTDDEVVFALTSGIMVQTGTSNSSDFGSNTWLVVLTSERFLFLDCAMLTSSVDTQSIRLENVQAVSSSQGWVLGKVMLDLGSRMLTVDNCVKATVSVVADLANKLLKEQQKQKTTTSPKIAVASEESSLDKLEKLAKLLNMGALSEDEFKIAKEKILAAM